MTWDELVAENTCLREELAAAKGREAQLVDTLKKIANPYDDLIGYVGADAKYLIKIAKKALEVPADAMRD